MSGPPLLAVEDLSVDFRVGEARLRAVDSVSLELRAGETLALVGESGCGKSTLARAIGGLVRVRHGSVRLAGSELVGLSRRAWKPIRRRVQMVFQDPDASLNPRMNAAALIGEPMLVHRRLRGRELDREVCKLMERVGLDPTLRTHFPHAFSGGQRQRIGIARALAVEPELLLCDEVTSALDVSIQAQILELLRELQRQLGIAILFITHDLAVVRHLADRVAVMYLGQIVETASAEALFAGAGHPYSEALLAAVPRVDGPPIAAAADRSDEVPSPLAPPPGCRFHPRCALALERCTREAPGEYPIATGRARCFLRA
ncbi:MAG: ABC transporter ATP-binding protein [Myxococcota bacterium]|nr:ABC transporter ATP-binding protein [Myxococcota bacterium]